MIKEISVLVLDCFVILLNLISFWNLNIPLEIPASMALWEETNSEPVWIVIPAYNEAKVRSFLTLVFMPEAAFSFQEWCYQRS